MSVKNETAPEVLAATLALRKSVLARLFNNSELVAVPVNLANPDATDLLKLIPGDMVVNSVYNAASEDVYRTQVIHIVSPRVLSILPYFRLMLDKVVMRVDPEKNREYQRKWYAKNKDLQIERTKLNRLRIREYVLSIKRKS